MYYRKDRQPKYQIGTPVTVDVKIRDKYTDVVFRKMDVEVYISQIRASVTDDGKESYEYGLSGDLPERFGDHIPEYVGIKRVDPFRWVEEEYVAAKLSKQ